MLIGYMRISSSDERQSVALQRGALLAAGADECHLHQDRASGARDDRPGLKACLGELRRGDVLVVWKLDRLGRSLSHLIRIVEELKARGIAFQAFTEAMDTTNSHGAFLFNLFGSLAEYERALFTERVNAGLAAARRQAYRELIHGLGQPSIEVLDQLVADRIGDRSHLGWVAEAPEGTKLKHLKGLIARLEVLRSAAIPDERRKTVHSNRYGTIAREARILHARAILRLTTERRYATLTAFVIEKQAAITDLAIDMFLQTDW